MQNTERWFTFSVKTTDRSQFKMVITHLFAQLMSKIHLPINVLHVNSVVVAFSLNAKIDVLSGLVSVYYYIHIG